MPDAVILFSGGVDSTLLVALADYTGEEVLALSILYGQSHQAREMDAARRLAERYRIRRLVYDARDTFADIGRASSLTGGSGTPVVPNRNAIFLSVAVGLAQSVGAAEVRHGANASDYANFPDCRPDFFAAMDSVARCATEGKVKVVAPLINLDKARIIRTARGLGVPLDVCWSCYRGEAKPCGVCEACTIRREASKATLHETALLAEL